MACIACTVRKSDQRPLSRSRRSLEQLRAEYLLERLKHDVETRLGEIVRQVRRASEGSHHFFAVRH